MTVWLLDTGPLVAFFDGADEHHNWARRQWEQAPLPLLTSESVLSETVFLLRRAGVSAEHVLELLRQGVLKLELELNKEAEPVQRLLKKYRDQEISLADACLVRMSELHRDCRIFTTDLQDFQVYRRFERQLIPLLHPWA